MLETIVKSLYSTYGKYISKFRAIPYHIDLLRPVERRMLLSLYDVARSKFVKSAKVVGHCMGNYHPHAEAYGTLVRIVNNGLAIGQGNWGSKGLEEDPPAAMRYTEVKLDPKIEELAFKFIKFVPWVNEEFADEPQYIPSPIPLGLIGYQGVNQGIAFHKTSIPTFTIQDLFKLVLYHLGIEKDIDVKPYLEGHDIVDIDYVIFSEGKGVVLYLPKYKISRDQKQVELYGVPQQKSKFYKFIENEGLEVFDYTSKDIRIVIKSNRKKINKKKLENVLLYKVSYDILVVDDEGKVFRKSINSIIEDNYEAYKSVFQNYLLHEIDRLKERIDELYIIKKIKEVLRKHNIKNTDQLKKHIKDVLEDKLINVLNKYSINRLVNIEVNIPEVEQQLQDTEKRLKFINRETKKLVKELAKQWQNHYLEL